MSKFDGFINYLKKCNEQTVVLTYDFIEKLMGCKLCDSAYKYIEYWQPAGHSLPNHIIYSGYKIESVDLDNETVVLKRIYE